MNDYSIPYNGPIVTRQEAIDGGLKRFFTGHPCNQGHVSQRMLKRKKSGKFFSCCVACQNEFQRKYKKDNPEKIKGYYAAHKARNPGYSTKYSRRWRKANPGAAKAIDMAGKARKLNATPPWADLEAIKEIYKNCPDGYHVDHYYPLQGVNFCGLHVESNLQCIPAEENLRKFNKSPEEFYGKNPPHD